MLVITVGCGARSRSSLGLAGGYPAAHTPIHIRRGADVPGKFFAAGRLPVDDRDLSGEVEPIPSKGLTTLGARDVFQAVVSGGGGGFGDPLRRDPGAVLEDVRQGLVSEEMARDTYGIILKTATSAVDEDSTRFQRERIRAQRLRKGAK